MAVKQLVVQTQNPKALDEILKHFNSTLEQNADGSYVLEDGAYIARCFGDAGFVQFALENQGYAKVIAVRDTQS